MLRAVPGLSVTERDHATLLGSPIGTAGGIQNTILKRTKSLQTLGNRLQLLHAHDAFCLLRNALAIPKVLYILRTSPCFLVPGLHDFDSLLRSLLGTILNVNLSDSAWTQASLPVRAGGLGVRSTTQLAPSAYLASAAGCAQLVQRILPQRLLNSPFPAATEALVVWQQGHKEPTPCAPDSSHQKAWDGPVVTAAAEALMREAPDELAQARLLASQRRESGEWLYAPPMSAIGLRMDDEVLRVAVGLRLGVTLCRPHKCHQCGAEVNHLGLHGLSCRRSQGRHPRHAAVNDLLKRSLASAKIPSLLEPTGIARSDGRRPDGISVMPWRNGRTLVWDATCPDTFAPSHVALAAREAGLVASQAEKAKTQKYALLGSSHHFVPIAIETSGVFGPEAITFIKELGHRIRAETGEPRSLQFLMQGIAVAVQRGNAAAVRGTSPPTDNGFI